MAAELPLIQMWQWKRATTGITRLPPPPLLAVELLGIDPGIDLDLRDSPLLHRRTRRSATEGMRKFDPVYVPPVVEVEAVLDHRRRLCVELLDLTLRIGFDPLSILRTFLARGTLCPSSATAWRWSACRHHSRLRRL